MKPYESEDKIVAHPIKETPKKTDSPVKLEAVGPTGIKESGHEEEGGGESGEREDPNEKFSMSKLCQTFIDRCSENRNHVFETKALVDDFGVKQRRIYDLMNIMEGCGCLRKLSKGKYEWVGIDNPDLVEPDHQKDSTSLRQIASKIKLLFSRTQGIISFNQINEKLLVDSRDRAINPSSIRRRIYECCKVLRILGFIDKIGKNYEWVYDRDKPRPKSNAVETRKTINRRLKRCTLTEGQLIIEVIRRYETVERINEFIEKLTTALKGDQQVKKEEVIFEE